MRNLTATLCLTLAVLLGTLGCAKKPLNGHGDWTGFIMGGSLERYSGEFKDGEFHGIGTYNYITQYPCRSVAGGDYRYKGEFKGGKKHGQGVLTKCGDEYVGEWRNDKPHGHFTVSGPSGSKYAGEIQDGKPHGLGTLTHSSGQVEEGIWERGQFKNTQKNPSPKTSRIEIERIKKNCAKFGFKDGTKEMSNCMFELYKLEKSSSSKTQTVIQNNTGDNSAVRTLLEEQKKQRQFNNSLELMQRGLEIMNPTRPKLTCKYNSFTKTTVCN